MKKSKPKDIEELQAILLAISNLAFSMAEDLERVRTGKPFKSFKPRTLA